MALAIVAIPKDDERVWKISSEKIPHLTLLMLGDNVNAEATALIVQFVEHAAKTTLHRFGLSVDKRGVLGAEYADVLFFEKSKWNLDRISDFRTNLLGDTAIKEAYLTTDQFDGWTPHLTLGYPATPAHTDDKDHEIGYVSFDKIAVWTDDYTGPTFDLSSEWDEDVAWSADMGIEAFMYASGLAGTKLGELMHHGIPGQRWGIRRQRGSDGTVSGGLKGGPAKSLRSKLADTTAKTGDRKIVVDTDGSSTVQEKQADGSWRKVEMSADAERIVKTSLKPGYDMSTKEIQDAVNRANLVKQYDTMFNPKKDPNAELQAKVQALELKMKYSQLQSQMNPSKLERVDRLVKSASSGFDAYNKLNKASDGRLNQGLETFFFGNKKYTPKHAIDLKTMKAKK